MMRVLLISSLVASLASVSVAKDASKSVLRGHYLEARTCQVYTGPCFANGEVGIAGKEAVMAWNIRKGSREGVDLAGLNVVVVVQASDTLGFEGIDSARTARCVILVDDKATDVQHHALVAFARSQAGKAGGHVARVKTAPIDMELDVLKLAGRLQAGSDIELLTRKARPDDCICSNESAYYPPLAQVEHFVPGVTIDGNVTARALGSRWSIPDTRSAYMATFAID